MKNMNKDIFSDFQLLGTRLAKVEVTNKFINLPQDDELETNIDMGNSECKIIELDNQLEGILQQYVNFSATLKSEKQLYIKISVMIEGCFITSSKDKELFNQMLMLNGNTTLYSILRAHITTISALSLGEGKIILPMINFTKLMDEQNNNQ